MKSAVRVWFRPPTETAAGGGDGDGSRSRSVDTAAGAAAPVCQPICLFVYATAHTKRLQRAAPRRGQN